MRESKVYEYAVLRFVPRVDREEFINIGVVLFCKDLDYLAVKTKLDEQRIKALFGTIDLGELISYVAVFHHIANGNQIGGPIAVLDLPSRFRWLTAKRSTILQISPIHSGLTDQPEVTIMSLLKELV
ncbi:MAG: DUF3037 domain-containing protein [Saprospiraceae bacterium]|jgi:hypothetical protein|nr:DUF3037 domain-containing protein [Saprospiraceae bacterium]MBP9195214.1 DUF3037 domain-containing protein [Saprospiraceae bacterium]